MLAAVVLVLLVLSAGTLDRTGVPGAVVLLGLCVLWILVNGPMEGVTLVTLPGPHGVTAADLASVAGARPSPRTGWCIGGAWRGAGLRVPVPEAPGRPTLGRMAEGALRVVFVCTANICRSAYAELMAGHLLDGDPTVVVSSAGTHGFRDHAMDPPMADQLRARGVDPEAFRSRPLTMRMVEQADLVLTAESVHRQFILDDRPEVFRRVFTLGQFARTLDSVADDGDLRGVRGLDLFGSLRGRYRPAEAADDLADPFRRGELAAAAAATRLDDLLRVVVPRLRAGADAPR
ncbi:MAG: hypothetical protein ACTHKG_03325 [Nocardioides sp.]